MTFNLDAVEHETKGTPWEFTAGGKRWRVPHISDLTLGQQIAVDSGRVHIVLNEVAEVHAKGGWKPAGREAASLVVGKHPDQIATLTAMWLAHAGMEPGESGASSPS
ncbi:hypothetical protein [Cellulomonas shaoxiangyii]|uniref:Uncharacterized protein n=1 Tax=Cellulomonas shaoxiangyii TaxID=2566013 RepID=A0A4P7SI60_9CELL|nr:hypothetical protein [Cellulomonas shaoxiangyii]QCB93298.1 hypothetical protein E5225_06785 [Cellulomonas shaoxiangyii]TGY82483.1 hypothetical protein E5226_13165 [Cellulomonas shaoxiangyii]